MKDIVFKPPVYVWLNKITEADDRTAENIFKNLVFKMLDLTESYEKMEQRSHDKGKQGIEDYIVCTCAPG